MKKYLWLFVAIFCILAFSSKALAYKITTDVKTKRIPAGIKLELAMANDIYSDNVTAGDMFSAYLTRDVRTQTTMILPKGTIVRGSVANVLSQRMLSRSAILYLKFDHVVAPNGSQIPIVAGIADKYTLDNQGGIKAEGSYKEAVGENWSKSGAIIKKATKWGITSGEDLFKGGRFLVTPFSATGGAIAGTGYFIGTSVADLFHKGNQVVIKKGEVFNILVLEPLDVPVSE